jgi:hypothetical protein
MSMSVVVEEGTNFPGVLGRKNRPSSIIRGQTYRLLDYMPGIADQAMAIVRGESPIHVAQKVRGQVKTLLNRRAPLMNLLKVTFPLRGQPTRNVPSPYERPGTWSKYRNIKDIPSVMGIISGPERTVHPSISINSTS